LRDRRPDAIVDHVIFVGQVMCQSGGNANPALVTQLVQERLG
jgi:Asp-tRNA(Asn)/Glu-tRNA(Gln) amidotransferase B subunit